MGKNSDGQSSSENDDNEKNKKGSAGKFDKRAEALRRNLKRRKAEKKKS